MSQHLPFGLRTLCRDHSRAAFACVRSPRITTLIIFNSRTGCFARFFLWIGFARVRKAVPRFGIKPGLASAAGDFTAGVEAVAAGRGRRILWRRHSRGVFAFVE